MSTIMQDSTIVDRPCPPWCGRPAGHGWEDHNIDVVGDDGRAHRGTVAASALGVGLSTFETSLHGGPSTFMPVVIEIADRHDGEEVTAKQARDIAAALLKAARIIEAATS